LTFPHFKREKRPSAAFKGKFDFASKFSMHEQNRPFFGGSQPSFSKTDPPKNLEISPATNRLTITRYSKSNKLILFAKS